MQLVPLKLTIIASLGPEMLGEGKYEADGVLATNGKVYFAAHNAGRVLSIDPETQTVEMLGQRCRTNISIWQVACLLQMARSILHLIMQARS